MRLEGMGILLEDPGFLLELPFIIYFRIEHPENVTIKNQDFSKFEISASHKQHYDTVLFLEVYLEQRYSPILGYLDSTDQLNSPQSVFIDLAKGLLISPN